MYPSFFVSSAVLVVVTRMKLKIPRKIANLDIAKLLKKIEEVFILLPREYNLLISNFKSL